MINMNTTHTIQFGTVSHGTLRTEDLIVTFLDFIDSHEPDKAREIQGNALTYLLGGMDADAAKMEVLDDCFLAMEALAPEGVYFGTIEGDGSDFGFWLMDTEDDEDEDSDENPFSGPGGLLDEVRQAERIAGTW